MVRGLERHAIFRDDTDRADRVARLARLAEQGALTVYAWALLPSHTPVLRGSEERTLVLKDTCYSTAASPLDASQAKSRPPNPGAL